MKIKPQFLHFPIQQIIVSHLNSWSHCRCLWRSPKQDFTGLYLLFRFINLCSWCFKWLNVCLVYRDLQYSVQWGKVDHDVKALLVQKLPSGVYMDEYQLETLKRDTGLEVRDFNIFHMNIYWLYTLIEMNLDMFCRFFWIQRLIWKLQNICLLVSRHWFFSLGNARRRSPFTADITDPPAPARNGWQ